jgi:succinate dehydrogenase / fumarate reductase, cytochrome b subunit
MRADLIGLVSDYPALEQEQELSMSAVASSTAAGRRRIHKNRFQRMLNSSIGLKITMALTGVILSGFVLVHMLGNLQVYQGAEALDAYGKLLRKEPALLWAFRLVLLSAVGLHVWAYLALTRNNLRARPQAYQARKYKASSFASRSMTLTGPLVLAFIIYHILHLTTGTVFPDFQEGAVYHNMVVGLGGYVGVLYIVAMIALAFHLWHGVWSMFQTLGAPEGRDRSLGRWFATIFTILVTLGFISVPLAVLTGFLKSP